MPVVTSKELLQAGVHFGHQTKKWNPKMKKYIFGERNKIYIINLQETIKGAERAYNFIKTLCEEDGRTLLFVGTKKQAQDAIQEEAGRCGMYYVNQRWLGGMLTNFNTIKARISYLKELEKKKESGYFEKLNKKEIASIEKEILKLTKSLGGIKEMGRVPDAIFVVDPQKEHIAIKEAHKLNIPIVAMVDTNCNPDEIDFVIPSNDDSIKSIKLLASRIADAVLEGKTGKKVERSEEAEVKVAPEAEAAPVSETPAEEGTAEASEEAKEAVEAGN